MGSIHNSSRIAFMLRVKTGEYRGEIFDQAVSRINPATKKASIYSFLTTCFLLAVIAGVTPAAARIGNPERTRRFTILTGSIP